MNAVFASGIPATNGVAQPATCDTGTLETSTGPAQLRANFTPEVINLRWYNENGNQITVPATSSTCTYDGAISLPPDPVRPGYKFKGWKIAGIPVEYIQGTGTQWIDTGYIPNNNTGVKTKIQFDTVVNNESCFFGAAVKFTERAFEFYLWEEALEFNHGYMAGYYANTPQFEPKLNVNDIIEIDWNKTNVNYKINNGNIQNYVFPNETFIAPYNMVLFGTNRPGGIVCKGKAKIYYFKIYDNDTLIRDFIPVKDSKGGAGMYDKVTGRFFYNAGTGDFIAGPKI